MIVTREIKLLNKSFIKYIHLTYHYLSQFDRMDNHLVPIKPIQIHHYEKTITLNKIIVLLKKNINIKKVTLLQCLHRPTGCSGTIIRYHFHLNGNGHLHTKTSDGSIALSKARSTITGRYSSGFELYLLIRFKNGSLSSARVVFPCSVITRRFTVD